jgi:hypothetical protein
MTHDKIDLQIEGIISNIKQIAEMIQQKHDARDEALDVIAIKKDEIRAWDKEIIILNAYMQESVDLATSLRGMLK